MNKICFVASTGGHLEQLMMLEPLMTKYDGFILTEKTSYSVIDKNKKVYYVKQVNRHEFTWIFKLIHNVFVSLRIFKNERPDVVISTGAMATLPICIIAKIFKKKQIFIESFAKINSPTLTGKLLYKFADQFYVQWEEMLDIYPNAVFKGGIY